MLRSGSNPDNGICLCSLIGKATVIKNCREHVGSIPTTSTIDRPGIVIVIRREESDTP